MSMEIKIDQEAILTAINTNATKAVVDALGGWEVQKAMAQVVTTEVAQGAIAEAIRTAVGQIDKSALVNALASELQKATTSAVVEATTSAVVVILHEGLVDIVCKLRGIGNYSEDDRRKRAAIKAELFKTTQENK